MEEVCRSRATRGRGQTRRRASAESSLRPIRASAKRLGRRDFVLAGSVLASSSRADDFQAEDFVREHANASADTARASFELGEGTWEVVDAPHIRNMSKVLLTEFSPIRYTLKAGDLITSNVRYRGLLVGEGWLSASGQVFTEDSQTLRIAFDQFWWDPSDDLREELGDDLTPLDAAVGFLGRAGFIPAFALFPVLAVTAEYAVFQFPPLRSNIAIRKVSAAAAL